MENLNRELEARFGSADSPEPSQAEWLDAKLKKWSDELKSRLKTALALRSEDTPEEPASWGFMKLLPKVSFLSCLCNFAFDLGYCVSLSTLIF